METFTVQAVYEKGVLKPRRKLNLPERTIVQVRVSSIRKATQSSAFASLIGVWEDMPAKKYTALEKSLTSTRKKSSAKVKRLAKKINKK
ncbi:MAG: hypothetical protein UZ14_CFX002000363 [Chloroflexi bacterium OLB14]|nr:MAG: hypothetical protein UZ14_CFX002000363 [Chloroflexi bacterium OLB14]